jgi:hypothetical protein
VSGRSSEEALHRIVVVGGGAAGMELVTQLGNRLGRRARASVTLVECARTHLWKPLLHAVAAGSIDPGEYEVNYLAQAHWHAFRYRFGEMIGLDRERILPGLPERISEAMHRLLDQLGIEVRTGAKVNEVTAQGLTLADGSFIASELVVWAAGVKAPEVLRQLDGLEINRINQLVVEPTLQTTRDPNVFAIGDCAACPRPGTSTTVPPRAQAAHQEASHMARQIERRLRGQPLRPYTYRDFGSLVSLGKWTTVGNLMGFLFGRGIFVEGVFAHHVPVAAPIARAGDQRHPARGARGPRPRSGAAHRPAGEAALKQLGVPKRATLSRSQQEPSSRMGWKRLHPIRCLDEALRRALRTSFSETQLRNREAYDEIRSHDFNGTRCGVVGHRPGWPETHRQGQLA